MLDAAWGGQISTHYSVEVRSDGLPHAPFAVLVRLPPASIVDEMCEERPAAGFGRMRGPMLACCAHRINRPRGDAHAPAYSSGIQLSPASAGLFYCSIIFAVIELPELLKMTFAD
jgi:hypothetical protein